MKCKKSYRKWQIIPLPSFKPKWHIRCYLRDFEFRHKQRIYTEFHILASPHTLRKQHHSAYCFGGFRFDVLLLCSSSDLKNYRCSLHPSNYWKNFCCLVHFVCRRHYHPQKRWGWKRVSMLDLNLSGLEVALT